MRLIDYLKDKSLFIFINIICCILVTILLFLSNVHPIAIIYIVFIMNCVLLFNIFYNYFRKKSFYNKISKILSSLDKEYLVTEMVKEPNFLEGKLLYNFLYDIDKSMIENINVYKNNSEEFKEYIELWCHEIKTPIATSKMIITNNKNETTKSINEEIDKIDNYIEQVLYYSRSNNVENDYIINEIQLNDIVDNVIKRNKKDLIGNKVKLNIEVNDSVYSDSKWLEFILNQIVANSIKYDSTELFISSKKNKNNVSLIIKDNGIGINEAELDKVFDKGFTGTNGRKKYKSTGIGLYLCKKLCDKLGHNIEIASIQDESTTITILFPIDLVKKNITGR